MTAKNLLACAVLLIGLGVAECRAEFVLVQDGKPNATIVVSKEVIDSPYKPEPPEFNGIGEIPHAFKLASAVHDLQLYIEKMSGAKIDVVSGDAPLNVKGNLIYVGRSAATAAFEAKIPKGVTGQREEEGYVILAKGHELLLAGNDDGPYHGTEYAVAGFLHRQGIRWYMPGEFGELIPQKRTVSIDDIEFHDKPAFKMRNWWGPQTLDAYKRQYHFKIRNGLNPMTFFIALPNDSSIRAVLPPQADIDKPDLADVWGKQENGKPHPGMPNLTNPKSVKYAVEKILEYLKTYPKNDGFGIGGDDGYPRDFTPATVKRNLGLPDVGGKLGIPGEMSTTEEWMEWINNVATELHKTRPDIAISTNGYANRNTAPQGVKFDPNIWIMFAAIWSDTLHAYDNPLSWQTQRQGEMIQAWTKQCKNVFMYNYTYYMLASAGAVIPLANKHIHDMPLYKKWGVVGFDSEGRYVAGEQGIFPNYLEFRMMWDPSLDPQKLADEFYRDWYGPAAKPARAFWQALDTCMETTPMLGHEDRILPYVYSPELITKLERCVQEAEKLATDAWSKPRVHADRLILEHLKGFIRMHEAEWRADFVDAVKQANYMLEQRKQLNAISPDYFDIDPKTGESVGFYYWGVVARRDYYQKLADLTTGKTGDMIAVLPEKAKFRIDPRDDGRFNNWYDPKFNDKEWDIAMTTEPFYTQDATRKLQAAGTFFAQPFRDAQGYPYMGAMWYRLKTHVGEIGKGRSVILYAPAVETEAWVWVNGQFAGHREYHDAYERPAQIEMDVTKFIRPGDDNSVVIRVHTGMNAAQQSAGMTSRLFLYSPKPGPAAPAK